MVVVREEAGFAVVPTLDDMRGDAGEIHPRFCGA